MFHRMQGAHLFIDSSINEYLGYFCLLAAVNDAVQTWVYKYLSRSDISKVRLLDHMVVPGFIFLRN